MTCIKCGRWVEISDEELELFIETEMIVCPDCQLEDQQTEFMDDYYEE